LVERMITRMKDDDDDDDVNIQGNEPIPTIHNNQYLIKGNKKVRYLSSSSTATSLAVD
jgi:hypothetical protein